MKKGPSEPADRERQVGRLRRTSGLLASACLIAALLLPVLVIASVLQLPVDELARRAGLAQGLPRPALETWQRSAVLLVAILPVGLLASGLFQAQRGLRLVARGELFAAQTVTALRRLAGYACAATLAGVLAPAVASVVLSYGLGPGQRQLVLGVGSRELLQLLTSGLVWLMAGLLAEGRALADENAQFV